LRSATSSSSSLIVEYLIEPVEHHTVLQTEVIELAVEVSIFGCECVQICGLIRDGRNGIASLLKKFGIIVRVVEASVGR